MVMQVPYCRIERDLSQAAVRLRSALQRKLGHIVVVGDADHDASIFVSVALDSIEAYQFLEVSAAERLDFGALGAPPRGGRTILVVYEADLLSGEDLAQAQLWTERSSATLNLVLVGTDELARTLAVPAARIFTALVHTRIALVPTQAEREAKASAERRVRRSVAAGLLVACALALGLSFTAGARGVPPQSMGTVLHETYASGVEWVSARLQ